jgi:hypothetical protein
MKMMRVVRSESTEINGLVFRGKSANLSCLNI